MKRKSLLISVVLVLLLATSVILSGCGGTSTLEEYVNNNEELSQQIESYSTSGMTIDISDNTLTYTYKYEQSFDDTTAKLMKSSLEQAMSSMDSTFESIKTTLIEETDISDIIVKIVYSDSNDTVLYEKEY